MKKRPVIEDNKSLEREMTTGAVLNRDSASLRAALEAKKKKKEQQERLQKLEGEVAELSNKIDTVLEMLQSLIRSKE